MSDGETAAAGGPLVHITTPSAWRVALSAGSLVAPSLYTEGFIDLSAPGRARAAGCDVVWLLARVDDWPRRWYERLGFADVDGRWEVVRRAST
jgi:hypothetical protein